MTIFCFPWSFVVTREYFQLCMNENKRQWNDYTTMYDRRWVVRELLQMIKLNRKKNKFSSNIGSWNLECIANLNRWGPVHEERMKYILSCSSTDFLDELVVFTKNDAPWHSSRTRWKYFFCGHFYTENVSADRNLLNLARKLKTID